MRSRLPLLLPLILSTLSFSCRSDDLRRNAVIQASSLTEVLEGQVLENLRKYQACDWAIPDHVRVTAGSSQVNDSASVTGGWSILPSVADSFSLGSTGSRSWTSNWTLTPVSDRLSLERLRFFYLWVMQRYRCEAEDRDSSDAGVAVCCESCLGLDAGRLRDYLRALFPEPRDALGRRTSIEWTEKTDAAGHLVLAGPLNTVQYEAKLRDEVDLVAKLSAIPTGWFRFDQKGAGRSEVVITDEKRFADFVLLTLNPDLRTLSNEHRIDDALARDSLPSVPTVPSQVVLDPGR